VVDAESLGGARLHTVESAVAHYLAKDDRECIALLREQVSRLPRPRRSRELPRYEPRAPRRRPVELYDVLPSDHRMSYDMREVLACFLDEGRLDEFQPQHAREMLCGHGRIEGRVVGVIANQRGVIKDEHGGQPRVGGIVYTESARKVAYFIETAGREGIPILFVQDVSGFMVGKEAETSGIIRAGAEFVEAMATAAVPKIVLTVNHASGAGYYAMAGQGFDPDFILSLPTGRMGVMEGESAVTAVYGPELEKAAKQGGPSKELAQAVEDMRADYERQLDALYAGARGFVDAIVTPEELRDALAFTLRIVSNFDGPHLGPYVLGGAGAGGATS
jgi:acetyl-CoA carboxylase carboxyltransferase component